MSKPDRDWRCRIGWHAYQRQRNNPSARSSTVYYLECRRCHKVRPLTEQSTQPYPIGDMDQTL
jgi:hypothetical protein